MNKMKRVFKLDLYQDDPFKKVIELREAYPKAEIWAKGLHTRKNVDSFGGYEEEAREIYGPIVVFSRNLDSALIRHNPFVKDYRGYYGRIWAHTKTKAITPSLIHEADASSSDNTNFLWVKHYEMDEIHVLSEPVSNKEAATTLIRWEE